jgi:geranylgeranyl pyrophosphate synthase
MTKPRAMPKATNGIAAGLGFDQEIGRLREILDAWIRESTPEIRKILKWQFVAKSKYFRPLTVFSCYRAVSDDPVPLSLVRSAAVLEMMHNVSLIIDDILDESKERRGKPTLHCKFGLLPALMASGYIVADGFQISDADRFQTALFSELLKRLAVAECLQWRLRREPLGVEDWVRIAGEDTGSMFETCALLATRDETFRRFGRLLGLLYHGCDDVGDLRGGESLGGGGEEDLRDGILTLPAAFAIRDPAIAALFCSPHPSDHDLERVAAAMRARLPEAEDYLDKLAAEANQEAHYRSSNPAPLVALVDHTRELSRR